MGEPSPQTIEELTQLRKGLKVPDLTANLFPHDLDVIDFDPKGKLRIRTSSTGQNIGAGLFSLFIAIMLGSSLGSLPAFLVVLAFFLWRVRLGVYVSINLSRRSYALFTPGSAEWMTGAPDVELHSAKSHGCWTTRLLIAELEVITRKTVKEQAHPDLETFVNALNARLGRRVPVKIAEGVYVYPD